MGAYFLSNSLCSNATKYTNLSVGVKRSIAVCNPTNIYPPIMVEQVGVTAKFVGEAQSDDKQDCCDVVYPWINT